MNHFASAADRDFRHSFEQCTIAPAVFDHRAHVRLAYMYLVDHDAEASLRLLRNALLNFLAHNQAPASKYHETMTRAWIMAVRHFMESPQSYASADDFIAHHPILLDSKIMLTHYSAEALFSEEARARFVQPDIEAIPQHECEA